MTDNLRWGVPIALGNQRVLREGRLRWLRAIAWMVALVFIIAIAFGPTMEAVLDLLPKDDPRLVFLTRCVGAAIALSAYALLVRLGEARTPSEIAIRPAIGQLLVGLAIGGVLFGVVMATMVIFGLYDVTFVGLAPAWRPAGLAIEASVVEELMIRGVVLRLLWRAFGPLTAFLLSAALFGAGHLPNPGATLFAAICVALEAGVMLGAFYALTGRLWVSIGVHMAWNFTQGYLFGAAVSGGDVGPSIARSTAHPDMPEWLTGGVFGPEASLPALSVCSAAGAVTLWLTWKAGRFSSNGALSASTNDPKGIRAAPNPV